ncbi:ubiquitin-conjugating enzyme/RWD-like protein [Dipodascopsis uninucleata]
MSAIRIRTDIAALFKNFSHPDIVLPSGPQDLTTITLYLLGPAETPYSQGAWKLTLKIPPEYPNNPPKAYFETKIFHPNVAVNTGEVCVDTLKRDWNSKVDLQHVLLVIRCLLIEPNPESALNEEAGKLLLENYADFERMARLMTTVHALKRSSFAVSSSATASNTTNPISIESGTDENKSLVYNDDSEVHQSPSDAGVEKNILRPLEHTQRGIAGAGAAPIKNSSLKTKEKASKKKVGIKRL